MTIKEFTVKYGITMEVEQVEFNPYNLTWEGNHYSIKLIHSNGFKMLTFFSQGYGIKGLPKVDVVLDCLLSDSDALNYNFDGWCDNFGLNNDSITAKKTFNQYKKQGKELKRFLGGKLFNNLKDCERL